MIYFVCQRIPMDEKYLIFTVREKQYALPSKIISEVTALEKNFPLPLVPAYVRGIINRYSVPYALIDICFLLLNEASNARKVIVLKEEVDKLAFLIDDVTDIVDLSPETPESVGGTAAGSSVPDQSAPLEGQASPGIKIMKIEKEEAGPGLISSYFEWKGGQVFCLEASEIINRIKQDFVQEV